MQKSKRTLKLKKKLIMADLLSVLGMTRGAGECLKYRILVGPEKISDWGHEYIRHLAAQIGTECQSGTTTYDVQNQLIPLVRQIVDYFMHHNAEPAAVDLLLEVEQLDMLKSTITENNFQRTCLYLMSCYNYLAEPEDQMVLQCAYDIFMGQNMPLNAMMLALKMGKDDLKKSAFNSAIQSGDQSVLQQVSYLLGRHGGMQLREEEDDGLTDDQREMVNRIIGNERLSDLYLKLARDMDVMEAKVPEDVYKTHLVESRQPSSQLMDSARQNLADSIVNAFVNAGFCNDKLVVPTPAEGETHWIFKNKQHGKISATASLGLISLWDMEGGLSLLDKYLYSQETEVVGGALIGVGVASSGVKSDMDPALALLSESIGRNEKWVLIGAVMGLGIAYAGQCKEEVKELLLPVLTEQTQSMEVLSFAALSLALVYVSSCEKDSVEVILQILMTQGEEELGSPFAKMLCVALGLLFLGKQDQVEATLEVMKTLPAKISSFGQVVLESIAYMGTGDVLVVQKLLNICGQHLNEPPPEGAQQPENPAAEQANDHQCAAVLGVGLIACCEELGLQMVARMLEHILQYCDTPVRRAVPLAIALLHVADPQIQAMDTLGRLSHDADMETAMNAVLALGMLGAGTNNSRLAKMLRSLSTYYHKDPQMLALVRIAQGLVHMGKGLLTISPFHTDRNLMSTTGSAALCIVLFSCLDMKSFICGSYHFMLYFLSLAIRPRWLMTLDEQGEMIAVPVRVGQAVDVVAQAGRPKTITGFQTHNTPVLLSIGERAELAGDQYVAVSSVLEGIVILKPNPDYVSVEE
eukprot:TRINITY_DN7425_c0_g2_i2.p1 TRINITY_DN7425_c0_g2~~TRINITY_DN7425_c0_g2_i2.p1  ORF type:complete len:808 (-),score=183.10 TRINITY_DN7425_c0_g2_i2:91-2514(-)